MVKPTNDQGERRCWCPCNCGCEEPGLSIESSGLCLDCEEGNHEISSYTRVPELIKLHEDIARNYKSVLEDRKTDSQKTCYCRSDDCRHKQEAQWFADATAD